MSPLITLLVTNSPHITCLQEAFIAHHEVRGFQMRLRDIGYTCHWDHPHHLCTIWRRGLSIAPLKTPDVLADYRLHGYALQMKHARFLLRNIHAPSSGATERRPFFDTSGQQTPSLFLDVGDWNCRPDETLHMCTLMPELHTFRRSVADDYITTIDGIRLPRSVAQDATVTALEPVLDSQHRPILCCLQMTTTIDESWRWVRPHPDPSVARWDPSQLAHITDLATTAAAHPSKVGPHVDACWSFWHVCSGGSLNPSTVDNSTPWTGGWSSGTDIGKIAWEKN